MRSPWLGSPSPYPPRYDEFEGRAIRPCAASDIARTIDRAIEYRAAALAGAMTQAQAAYWLTGARKHVAGIVETEGRLADWQAHMAQAADCHGRSRPALAEAAE